MPAEILTNARVFDGTRILEDHSVRLEDGRIVDVMRGVWPTAEAHDLGGNLLAPGFIDLQVNGGGGVLFNDVPTGETVRRIGAAHRQFGTTGFLPTLISSDRGTMEAAIGAVQDAISDEVPGVLGIHLEGPFLNPKRKGAHNAAAIRKPQPADIELLCQKRLGKTLLTLAPEKVDDDELKALHAADLILFAGHTDATQERINASVGLGLRGFTHLFNAMSQMTSREPGVVGAALAQKTCWCGIIADGLHVHPMNLRMALAQTPGRVFLVTDAMPIVGTTEDSFTLDGRTVLRQGSRLTLPDGTLAGSCLDMATAVRNAVHALGVPVPEALRMASAYPAAVLGLQREYGRIAPGYRADLVQLDDNMTVLGTWVGGRYERP